MATIALLIFNIALAASSAHGEGHSQIPVMTIVAQAVNFGALILILVFLTRKQVRSLFTNRRQEFDIAVQRAQAAKKDAENRQKEILAQLKEIEDTYQDSINKATAKAESVRQSMVEDAKQAAERIRQETEATYKNEVNSAIMSLKAELLSSSIESAETLLKTKMQKSDHENLQDSLMKTIGVAK
ncbi:MAG: ATP synthase F0 subunit B [Bdellovibrionales bacterium]|nr:ATP synthase F0 subunit B [Bdellovibrionales bacterium]